MTAVVKALHSFVNSFLYLEEYLGVAGGVLPTLIRSYLSPAKSPQRRRSRARRELSSVLVGHTVSQSQHTHTPFYLCCAHPFSYPW